jgi:mannose-6-phosphate isomerase-like protein (cupin superfamily)
MHAFELADLAARQAASGRLYLEFLREATLSAGLYVLPAGAADPQQPHDEDEVYVVMSGRGQIRVGDEDRVLQAGSVVFVGRGAPHYFHTIEEDLRIIVLFAPPESA